MKIVLFDRSGVEGTISGLRVMADSSITPPGRPVFMPDFSTECRAEFHLAVKMSRLGKDIAAKFAVRYFESFAVALRLIPKTDLAGAEMLIDNGLTFSEWVEVDDVDDMIELDVCGQLIRVHNFCDILSQSVVELSRYCTLKTGDILLPLRLGAPIAIGMDTPVSVSLTDRPLLNLKIK